jgi:hypothetical protein
VIRKSLYKLLRWAQNYGTTATLIDNDVAINTISNSIGARGMNFSLYSASGGYIVEYRSFDEKRGENNYNLHIINSDENLGEKIGEIVTLELLRN